MARRDVPTASLRERLGDVQGRVRAAGWNTCLVVNEAGIILGRLREKALAGDPESIVEDSLQSGPSTFRPSISIEELSGYLKKQDQADAVISTADGRLVGLFTLADAERALAGARAVKRSRRRQGLADIVLGYKLSSEEQPPATLIQLARRAESAGFRFAAISDHFHPWLDQQGESPFAWTILGAVANVTREIRVGTGVACPTMRVHPAIVAQAAATVAALMPGRFFLGLGSGEYLNEHILGDRWPAAAERLEMLEEAIGVIRQLWQGGLQRHQGRHYQVENAQIYSLPGQLPPIYVAASGPKAAQLAGRVGDGLIGVTADPEIVDAFTETGGEDKPRYAELTVCWAPTEAEAIEIAGRWWAMPALGGERNAKLQLPHDFEHAAAGVRPEDVARAVICGPDPEKHIEGLRHYVEAGFDHIWIHQIGPDQEGFFRFFKRAIRPKVERG